METIKKAYHEVLEVLKKHKDILAFDIDDLERKSKIHLFGIDLKEKHGLEINPKDVQSTDFFKPNDHTYITWYGEKFHRTIAWPVDGRQPEDELLMQISFPTGAYIFGEDYPTSLFQKFWLELKAFEPDYVDEVNHGLYWKIENSQNVFNSFRGILKKYHELNKEDFKQRKIERMKAELEKLQNSEC